MLSVAALPAFSDNYIWLIHNEHAALVVDPGESQPVILTIDQLGLKLMAILNTHHHADHVDGNFPLKQRYNCAIYGPGTEPIPHMTHPLVGGEHIVFPDLDLTFQVIATPGHTRGHLSYYGAGHLFCGDTLFGCGCGRLFEGTAEQMHRSLSLLGHLPDDTLLCCAHEYTLDNIRFAKTVDGGNPHLIRRERDDLRKREQGLPTLPSTLGLEKLTNPFLRCGQSPLIKAAAQLSQRSLTSETEVFATIRAAKDRFRA
jgi:hydroxyacylglutathione hydrolase